jgi:non-ribosomal peptide synthetase component F
LARALSCRGVLPGDLVGLYLPKSIESIIALFGVLLCGGGYVPIDPNAPKNRVRSIIENCSIRVLIASNTLLKRNFPVEGDLDDLDCLVIIGVSEPGVVFRTTSTTVLWQEALDTELVNPDVWIGSDSTPAYILHTSGSTGNPKGVVISHLNALTFVRSAIEHFELDGSDRFACHAPLHFDLTVFDIYVSIFLGATLILIPDNLSVFPLKLSEYIRKQRVTVWNSVSSVLSLIADMGCHGDERFEDMRLVIFSGEVLPVKYLNKLKKHMVNATFCNIYGQTEANSSTCYVVDEIPPNSQWVIPVGKPLPNF